MKSGKNRWIAAAISAGLVAVIAVGAAVISRGGPTLFAFTTTQHSATASIQRSSSPSSSGSSPSVTPSKPSQKVSPTPGASPTVGTTSPPILAPASPPPPPAYSFAPPASGSGPAPATSLVTADLAGSRLIVASFRVTAAGSVVLHGFSGVTGLAACLEFAGQGCSPTPVAFNPTFWSITADDVAHHADYAVRLSANFGGGGVSFGWNGPRSVTVSNLPMPGPCTAMTGYRTGCGVRFRVATGAGSLTVAAGPGELHLKLREKVSAAVACDTRVVGAVSCTVSAGQWTGHLYPQTAAPGSTTMTVSWP